MAFKASDYPEITKASNAYDVARSDFQNAEKRLSETKRTSPNYQRYLSDRNAKKQKMDKALSDYKTLVAKRKKTYEETQLRSKYQKQLNTNKSKLKTLEDDLQRAKDKGEDTASIEALIKKIEDENKKAQSNLSGIGSNKRPKGVPEDAKFNSVTGNWEAGSKKWDKNGQAVVATKTKATTKPSDKPDSSAAYSGSGNFDSPLLKDGKRFSGDYNGKKYENGILVPEKTSEPKVAFQGVGTADDPLLSDGKPFTGNKDGKTYKDGVETGLVATGEPKGDSTPAPTPFEKIFAEAVKLYGGIDEIFSSDEELKNLLIRAVGDVTTAKDDMDEDQFVNLLQNTNWFKSNAGPIRQRGFEKRQYDALVKKIKTDDPNYKTKVEELNKTSTYGRGLQDVIDLLRENAIALGRQISEDDLRVIAQGIYDYANEDDAVKIRNAILGVGSFGIGLGKDGKAITGVATGAAGQNLTTLRAVARANGFDLDTMFKDSVGTWLDKIAKGESIETFKSIIRNTAKSGLPDKVAQLLDQGVDLETIYSPYKRLMSAVLELNPDSIDLNDPTLRMGIGPDKEVSLYEYQRMLRKDPRWQYTDNAREDVSNSALTVLRNFGFQG